MPDHCAHRNATPIGAASVPQFDADWAPGTILSPSSVDSDTAIYNLTIGSADLAVATRRLTGAEAIGKYEWQIAKDPDVFVATRDTKTVPRTGNPQQVRTDDWISYITSREGGQYLLQPLGYMPVSWQAAPWIPDADVNMAGDDNGTSLGDIGQVVGNWGLWSSCRGWIRPDADNQAPIPLTGGKVSLGDIGTLAQHWGNLGFHTREWFLLPGCCGLYSEWGYTQYSSGGPDHHDDAPTQHAVDIGAGWCGTSCPDVFYVDKSHSVRTELHWSQYACDPVRNGGERVDIDLFSLDPPDKLVGTVSYLHLTNALRSGSPLDGDRLGTIDPAASTDPTCWTGPHLHQGVDISSHDPTVTVTLDHFTGVLGSGANCQGYPKLNAQGTPQPDPANDNNYAHTDIACYRVAW